MRLSKDESRILADILDNVDIRGMYVTFSYERTKEISRAIDHLKNKLEQNSKDHRRVGRKSMNDFNDCMNRFLHAYRENSNTPSS